MTWKPVEDTDREVRLWMKAKGWEVTGAEYDFKQKIYTLRARSIRSGHSPTIRISQRVLEERKAASTEHVSNAGMKRSASRTAIVTQASRASRVKTRAVPTVRFLRLEDTLGNLMEF